MLKTLFDSPFLVLTAKSHIAVISIFDEDD